MWNFSYKFRIRNIRYTSITLLSYLHFVSPTVPLMIESTSEFVRIKKLKWQKSIFIFYRLTLCRLPTVPLSKWEICENWRAFSQSQHKHTVCLRTVRKLKQKRRNERNRKRKVSWREIVDVEITHIWEKKIRSRCQIANANRYENLSRPLLITHLLVSCFLLFLSLILMLRHCLLFLCPWSFLAWHERLLLSEKHGASKMANKTLCVTGGKEIFAPWFCVFRFY